jgi:hypothetical protein
MSGEAMDKAETCDGCMALQKRYDGISCRLRYPLVKDRETKRPDDARITPYLAAPRIACPKPMTHTALADAEPYSMAIERRIRQTTISFPDRRQMQLGAYEPQPADSASDAVKTRADKLEALADAVRKLVETWPYDKNELFISMQKALREIDDVPE